MAVQITAQALLVICAIAALGMAIGQVSIARVRLGVGGVLFAGLAVGHFGFAIDPTLQAFIQDFGLVLFVYAIGVAIGPGFFESFKRDGLVLNAMAVAVVLIGTLIAVTVHLAGGVELPALLGVLAGATTNTPSLAAGQQVLRELGFGGGAVTGMAYAVAYPFGIVGTLLAMLIVRAVCRLDPLAAAASFEAAREAERETLDRVNIEIRNPAVVGCRVRELQELRDMGMVLSRVMHDGEQRIIDVDDVLTAGDIVLAVGPRSKLDRLTRLLGPVAALDLRALSSTDIRWERVVITRSSVLGRSLAELDLRRRHGVIVTRVSRADHDLVPVPSLRFQFGDILTVVGDPAAIRTVSDIVGNRSQTLQETQMMPIFIGIGLGVLVGAVPIAIHGLPVPVRLGLAGGPLLAAIALVRIGHVGPVVWFMPPAAHRMMRDFGIALFLAAVGLKSGAGFLDTLLHGSGLRWMGWGAAITLVPLLVVGLAGWRLTRLNFLSLCGVLAGSMTDPPALAFAQGMSSSEAPILSYATVYPLAMVCRVVAPQLVALLLST